jgi:hypothetical protein
MNDGMMAKREGVHAATTNDIETQCDEAETDEYLGFHLQSVCWFLKVYFISMSKFCESSRSLLADFIL